MEFRKDLIVLLTCLVCITAVTWILTEPRYAGQMFVASGVVGYVILFINRKIGQKKVTKKHN